MKRYGRPRSIVTDLQRSYRAVMKMIGKLRDELLDREIFYTLREATRWARNGASTRKSSRP